MITPRSTVKILISIWNDFTAKRIGASASRLTYSTLLATIPILAVVFAIARGFGYNFYIEDWFRRMLEAQPEVCETIIGFVNSYLKHTQKGLFLGIGLLFMLWTVLMLISDIEQTFNDIWQVKRQRSLFRTFTDYISLLFIIPIFIVCSSGLSIWVTAFHHNVSDVILLGSTISFLIQLTPYILTSVLFTALYIFMPNTRVGLKHAIIPGIVAGIAFQLFQTIYINSQIWISSYNAIYGSFAILPFFILSIQISWTICLTGAEMCYMLQNKEDFTSGSADEPLCYNSRIEISDTVMSIIKNQFSEGKEALTAMQLKEMTGISMRILTNILFDLVNIHFLSETNSDLKGSESSYQPAEGLALLTRDEMIRRLNKLGAKIAINK